MDGARDWARVAASIQLDCQLFPIKRRSVEFRQSRILPAFARAEIERIEQGFLRRCPQVGRVRFGHLDAEPHHFRLDLMELVASDWRFEHPPVPCGRDLNRRWNLRERAFGVQGGQERHIPSLIAEQKAHCLIGRESSVCRLTPNAAAHFGERLLRFEMRKPARGGAHRDLAKEREFAR